MGGRLRKNKAHLSSRHAWPIRFKAAKKTKTPWKPGADPLKRRMLQRLLRASQVCSGSVIALRLAFFGARGLLPLGHSILLFMTAEKAKWSKYPPLLSPGETLLALRSMIMEQNDAKWAKVKTRHVRRFGEIWTNSAIFWKNEQFLSNFDNFRKIHKKSQNALLMSD